jgi:predicted Zn-dependent protease
MKRPFADRLGTLVLALAIAAVSAQAQDPAPAPPEPALTGQEAREARIREYLRKKEEKRLARERKRAEEALAAQARGGQPTEPAAEPQAAATTTLPEPAAAPAAAPTATAAAEATPPPPGKVRLPRELERAQAQVRRSELAQDPTVARYLDLIDVAGASPQQLAAFGSFLAQNGMAQQAIAYYNVALHLVRDDSTLWVNAGTIQRQLGNRSAAASAYDRALSIDANNALAHYNLGAIYDAEGEYDRAIASFRTALRLDPSLGDPTANPQAIVNPRMLEVKLLLLREGQAGRGLPLRPIAGGELPEARDGANP